MSPFIKKAASLIICVPHGKYDFKVLMVLKGNYGFFGNATVFPGGTLSPADADPNWNCVVEHCQDQELRICALRETFEETGILITQPPMIIESDERKNQNFLVYCKSRMIRVEPKKLIPLCNFVTPPQYPERFDAQFYITRIDIIIEPCPDGFETTSATWMTPHEALMKFDAGQIKLFTPQLYILQYLSKLVLDDRKNSNSKIINQDMEQPINGLPNSTPVGFVLKSAVKL